MLLTSVNAMAEDFSINMGSEINITDITEQVKVPLKLSNSPIDVTKVVKPVYGDDGYTVTNESDIYGLAMIQLDIEWDSAVLEWKTPVAGDIANDFYPATGRYGIFSNWKINSEIVSLEGTKKKTTLLYSAKDSGEMDYGFFDELEDVTMINCVFNVVEGTTAKSTEVKYNYVEFIDSKSVVYKPVETTNVTINLPQTTKYTVSASANNAEYGTVALDANEVEEGGKVTVTATPAEGYAVESYSVNGGDAVAVNTNTFEVANITADTAIVVNFKKLETKTVVTTFQKRLYTADGTLYTGVTIYEGDDYKAATTIKAGINIEKANTTNGVNYWLEDGKTPVSIGNNTSVYVIGLNKVSADTDITTSSASKGVVIVDNNTYTGEATSELYE